MGFGVWGLGFRVWGLGAVNNKASIRCGPSTGNQEAGGALIDLSREKVLGFRV